MRRREALKRRQPRLRAAQAAATVAGTRRRSANFAPAVTKEAKYPAGTKKGRVVILGFDGVEPTIVYAMFAANELPNLARLGDEGSYERLTSSIPPQSPSAWSSFITCKNTGAHGIYDFIVRDTATYFPKPGFGKSEHVQLDSAGAVVKPAQFVGYRKGNSFWKEADSQGLKCISLTVPFAFPADDLAQAHMLCGLGVQDIRGTDSSFFSFSDSYSKVDSVGGGTLFPRLTGIPRKLGFRAHGTAVKSSTAPGAFTEVPLEFTVNRTRTPEIKRLAKQ